MSSKVTDFGPPEHVYVENGWYDGPRGGIANVGGVPSRFTSLWEEEDCFPKFMVWPVDAEELSLEQEQWQIFVAWNLDYESGRVAAESHPGVPGMSVRWEQLEQLLAKKRQTTPANAYLVQAEVLYIGRDRRYTISGPDYQIRWRYL